MNTSKRFVIQAILWLLVWALLWVDRGKPNPFFNENVLAYIFQILLIAVLLWRTAPRLLFQKKYLSFTLISIVLWSLSAYVSSIISLGPPLERLAPLSFGGGIHGTGKPPSKLMVHLLMIALAYSLATLVETFVYVKRKEQETIKQKNENLQTELKLLKSQINPHFLFNALNNIYALSVMNSQKTQESISDLSNMLRYVLYDCEQPLVPVEKEVAYIQDYIRLFSLKSSEDYAIDLKINLERENVQIAPMLLIPFIENAFKHSSIENRDSGYISIAIKGDAKHLYFTVENSVPSIVKQKDIVGGIGLFNVQKRLDILYPNAHTLEIQNRKETYHMTLKISLNG